MILKKEKITEDLQRWIKKGEWHKAISALDQLARLEPQNPIHRLRKGDYCLKVGARQEAIEAYHQAASIFTEGGFIVKALAAYKMILRLDPQDSKAQERMENLHAQAQASVKAQPYLVMPEAAPSSPGMDQEGALQREGPAVEVVEVGAEQGMEQKTAGEEPALLDEGVVGVQPLEFEPLTVPTQEDLPPGERVEVAASGAVEMELTSLADSQQTEAAEPVAAPPGPEADEPTGPRRVTDVTPLFSSLSREEFRAVVERMIPLSYPSQYPIIKEGEKDDSVFVISQGRVRVVTHVGGREVHLADLKDSDFFGEVGFLTGRPRTASVITTQETEILELRGEDLKAIVEQYPGVREVLENFYRARVRDAIAKVKSERGVV